MVVAGLRVYYNLFIAAYRTLKDFLCWFLYVLITLSFVVIALFQVHPSDGQWVDTHRHGSVLQWHLCVPAHVHVVVTAHCQVTCMHGALCIPQAGATPAYLEA